MHWSSGEVRAGEINLLGDKFNLDQHQQLMTLLSKRKTRVLYLISQRREAFKKGEEVNSIKDSSKVKDEV